MRSGDTVFYDMEGCASPNYVVIIEIMGCMARCLIKCTQSEKIIPLNKLRKVK